jgi:hypothetical protein
MSDDCMLCAAKMVLGNFSKRAEKWKVGTAGTAIWNLLQLSEGGLPIISMGE